jgi:HEAT repeats
VNASRANEDQRIETAEDVLRLVELPSRDWLSRLYDLAAFAASGALVAAFQSAKSTQSRYRIVRVVRRRGEPASLISMLADLLAGSDENLACEAAGALGSIGTPDAMAALGARGREQCSRTLRSSLLGAIEDGVPQSCLDLITQALHDQDDGIRREAAKASERAMDQRLAASLLAAHHSETHPAVRQHLAQALDLVGYAETQNHEDVEWREEDTYVGGPLARPTPFAVAVTAPHPGSVTGMWFAGWRLSAREADHVPPRLAAPTGKRFIFRWHETPLGALRAAIDGAWGHLGWVAEEWGLYEPDFKSEDLGSAG